MYTRLRCGGALPLREDSVPETGFYGTEYACRAQKGFLGYATHFQRPSVLKTGFWGTEGKFGTRNTLLRYEVQFAPLLRYGVQFIIQRRDAPETTFWCME